MDRLGAVMPLLAAPDATRCSVYRVTALQHARGLAPYCAQFVDRFPDAESAVAFCERLNAASARRGEPAHWYVTY